MLNQKLLNADDTASRSLVRGDRQGASRLLPVRPGKIPSRVGRPGVLAPETVLQSFNTWAFKREQPADPQLMLQIIAEAIAQAKPVPFVLYWGKGPRCGLDEPDTTCLDYLSALTRRVCAAYEGGVAVKLIFTDTHADLNGHSPEGMRSYFGSIEAEARQRGFDSCWLGELVRNAAAVGHNRVDDAVPQDTLERLSACAAKWYRGQGTPEQGAAKYFQMNMIEKRAVEHAFPRSIFITFNGSEYRSLFPEALPIFYMYSLRRGVSVKPWFLPTVAAPSIIERTVQV
jgi:hypothetical protein